MSRKKAIIIHGTESSPDENWFPWLADKLRDSGADVVLPLFPTPDGQSFDSWSEAFNTQVGELDQHSILIGHSIGGAFALRKVEESSGGVDSLFLISSWIGSLGNQKFDSLTESFFAKSFNWNLIRSKVGKMHQYHGHNDTYVPLVRAWDLCKDLSGNLRVIPDGGHLNSDAGYTEFELLLSDLKPRIA